MKNLTSFGVVLMKDVSSGRKDDSSTPMEFHPSEATRSWNYINIWFMWYILTYPPDAIVFIIQISFFFRWLWGEGGSEKEWWMQFLACEYLSMSWRSEMKEENVFLLSHIISCQKRMFWKCHVSKLFFIEEPYSSNVLYCNLWYFHSPFVNVHFLYWIRPHQLNLSQYPPVLWPTLIHLSSFPPRENLSEKSRSLTFTRL